jgi:nitrite reductase (NADH) large subunit
VDDSLGIAAELDAAMDQHVAAYQDEWAAVLADPAKLRRFVSFVNAPGVPDPSIAFVSQRGQPSPAGQHSPAVQHSPVGLPMPLPLRLEVTS